MAPNTIIVAGYVQVACRLRAGCAQAARRLRVKKTRHRLVGRVAKCPQLRANCVNHQPLRPLVGYHILPIRVVVGVLL